MSSLYSTDPAAGSQFAASKCIDGIRRNPPKLPGIPSHSTQVNVCLSASQADPWLSVAIEVGSVVSEVVVYGREDCCNEKYLNDFEVSL